MRIAYFVNRYPTVSHSFIRREVLALEARGHEVLRYALDAPLDDLVDPSDRAEGARTKLIFREPRLTLTLAILGTFVRRPRGVARALATLFEIGPGSDRGLLRHVAYFLEAAVVAAWCSRDRVEHIHAHFGTNSAAVALLVERICGLPFSFTVHGPDEFDRPEALSLRVKVRRAAFVVAVSSYGRSQLMRWSDVADWEKLKIVHCGLDGSFRVEPVGTAAPETADAGRERRLVCVGRLAEQKGYLVLLDAIAGLVRDGFRFQVVLAGDGPTRSLIERRLKDLALEDIVTITGWISGKQVIAELGRADVMVLPSLAEGLPVAIMEAMALRRPVISTFIAGIPELVQSGETGWLVPAGNVEELIKALRIMLTTSPERLHEMGHAANQRVFERHDIAKEVVKLERCIMEAA